MACDLVVAEAYNVLRFHYRVPRDLARKQLAAMLTSGLVAPEPGGHALEALVEGRSGPAPVDRMIRGRYRSLRAETATFDAGFGKLSGVSLLA